MSSIELGELNLKQGKHAVAFDIFFELAQLNWVQMLNLL